MSLQRSLKSLIPEKHSIQPRVEGTYQVVKACFDPRSLEFFNVGVAVQSSNKEHRFIRLLNNFDRLRCLYDSDLDEVELVDFFQDLEYELYRTDFILPESDLNMDYIQLSHSNFAAGESLENIADSFYESLVTLGKTRSSKSSHFGYKYTSTLKREIFSILRERLELKADLVIRESLYHVDIGGVGMDLDIPLLSKHSAGAISSAWYSNPLMVKSSLVDSYLPLMSLMHNSDSFRNFSISILRPGVSSGMKSSSLKKVDAVLKEQIENLTFLGIDVLQGTDHKELGEMTSDYWGKVA